MLIGKQIFITHANNVRGSNGFSVKLEVSRWALTTSKVNNKCFTKVFLSIAYRLDYMRILKMHWYHLLV